MKNRMIKTFAMWAAVIPMAVSMSVISFMPVNAMSYTEDYIDYDDEDFFVDIDDEETNDSEAPETNIYMLGAQVGADNSSGVGWSYDADANTLTLDNFNYEGTGIFKVTGESSDDDNGSEVSGDDDWDNVDIDDADDEYSYFEDDVYAWDRSADGEETEETSGEVESGNSLTGVIKSEADLTLHLNGVSRIAVTDDGSDASYGVNVAGELKVEGDGVLYIESAAEEKVYGTEPKEETPADSAGTINNNTNDIDASQNVNEAPVTQNIEEAPVTQDVDEGDVSVNNDNYVNLPDIRSSISFTPNVNVEAPKTYSGQVLGSNAQNRVSEAVKSAQIDPEKSGRCADAVGEASAEETKSETSEFKGEMSEPPETGDEINMKELLPVVGTFLISAAAAGFLIVRRIKDY